jgi:hypothetical protein
VVQVLHDSRHPSYLELPTLGNKRHRLSVPDLTRG